MVLGTIAGVTGGTSNFVEYQLEKVTYYNKLSGLIEKTHNKPELLAKLRELNNKANQLKEESKSAGFFDSIGYSLALAGISVEQNEISTKLDVYNGKTTEFTPPCHPWLNLTDSPSFALTKSIAFSGVIGGGLLKFYYLSLPSLGVYNLFKQYISKQIHNEEMRKLKEKQQTTNKN